MLAVRDDGLVEGSVSGGGVEDDIVGRVRQDPKPSIRCAAQDRRREGVNAF
jgi:xanthine dehydrogenase accessory factor